MMPRRVSCCRGPLRFAFASATLRKSGLPFMFVALCVFVLSLLDGGDLAGAEEATKVAIRKVNGRTKAVVTVEGAQVETAKEEKNKVTKTMTAVEKGALEMMSTSNELVGRGTDQAVQTVQSFGDSMFSWLFRMLDFRKASKAKDQ